MLSRFTLAGCLVSSLSAQQTLVVDIAGGTPYQQVQAAITAANAGDRIEIRPGAYSPFVVDRAVHIFGEAGVVITSTFQTETIEVDGIPAGMSCSIHDVDLRSPQTPCICEPSIRIVNCLSAVLLDEVFPEQGSLEPRISVATIQDLVIRDSYIGPTTVTAGRLWLDGTVAGPASSSSGSIINLLDAQLDMTDGEIRMNFGFGAFAFGVELTNSTARLRSVLGLQFTQSSFGLFDFFVDSSSNVQFDPGVSFVTGAPTVFPTTATSVVAVDQAGLRVSSPTIGSSAVFSMRFATNPSFVCPFLTLPTQSAAAPGIGDLFVAPAFSALIGCFPTSGAVTTASVAIPAQPALQGQVYLTQALAIDGGLSTTNVDVLRIR
ncbi:MAG: hypothetical protein ACE37K_18790 [Planctomycetota bacterium]